MAALSHWATLPLALLCWAAQVGATTFPATVEVDLIFPQNDTYAPVDIFPLVFAWQNAALAPSLNPGINMVFRLYNGSKSDLHPELIEPTLDLSETIFNASEPTFVYGHLRNLTGGTGDGPLHVYMTWETMAGNCSDHGQTHGGGYVSGGVLEFTMAKGGKQPDLVAATSNRETCKNMTHAAFNLTGTQHRFPELDRPYNSCAVFSDVQPRPEGDPCRVQVSPSAATSIAAALESKECAFPHPIIHCEPTSAAAGCKQRFAGYSAFGGLLAALVAILIL
ncbi:hypothetical protein PG988_007854 [Apiospora saccharicola]